MLDQTSWREPDGEPDEPAMSKFARIIEIMIHVVGVGALVIVAAAILRHVW